MIIRVDSDAGVIKIGSPPQELPGIVESVKISDSLLIERKEIQGRSGKAKEVQGWDDASLLITLSLIDDPKAGKIRWDSLKHIADIFKKVSDSGKPEIYTLSHPMANAWRTNNFLFSSLETAESRARRKINVSLEFVEYESASGVIQDRQEAETQAQQSAPAPASAPVVSDRQQREIGRLEGRYADT